MQKTCFYIIELFISSRWPPHWNIWLFLFNITFEYINWRDVQTKNVVNIVDMSCLRAPWQNGPYKNLHKERHKNSYNIMTQRHLDKYIFLWQQIIFVTEYIELFNTNFTVNLLCNKSVFLSLFIYSVFRIKEHCIRNAT